MSAPVFITHSSRDYKRSRSVVDVLEKNGFRCWISERDIGAGDNYGDAIVDAIENAKVMVLVFSANANSSDEIKKEIALASQRKLTVVPIRIEDATPSKAFRYELITRNWIDCFPDWHRGMETLVHRVSSIVNDTPVPDVAPPALPKPKTTISSTWIAAGVAGVLIIGGAAAYGLWPRPMPVGIASGDGNDLRAPPGAAPKEVADISGDQTPSRAHTLVSPALRPSAPGATVQPEKPAADAAPKPPPSPALDVSPKAIPTTSASGADSKPEPTPTKPTKAVSTPKPAPFATEPKAVRSPSEADASSMPGAAVAKPTPALVTPESPPSPPPGGSAKFAPTTPAPQATSKPDPTPTQPATTEAVPPAKADPPSNTAQTIAKPEPAPVVVPKPTPMPSSKKTVIAALGPVVPVQAIAPPAHPKAPAIGSKPPPYNAAMHGGQIFQECKDCPQMVVVPRGTAILGSPQGEPGRNSNEASPHSVAIDKPFAVSRYAVTFDEWDVCLADGGCNGYKPDDNGFGRGKHPVIFVSWNDANAYVAWLKKKTGRPYRLPSESEWEYAARGCSDTQCPDTPFWFGDISPDLANYDSRYSYEGSPKAERELGTVPVDQGKPNPFGLTNMLGNVQQWVEDCWNADPSSAPTDGSALLSGDCGDRVIRGGSYSDKPSALRAAARAWDATDDRESPNVGFRVARTLAP